MSALPSEKESAMTTPKVHELKCWPEFYGFIESGAKPFEIRKNDRGFHIGDRLLLREWDQILGQYTGRHCEREITFTTDWAQQEGHVVLGLASPALQEANDRAERAQTSAMELALKAGAADRRAEKAEAALAALPADREPVAWIPVADREPDKEGWYVVAIADPEDIGWETKVWWRARWDGNYWVDADPIEDGQPVTHWLEITMPATPSPSDRTQEGKP